MLVITNCKYLIVIISILLACLPEANSRRSSDPRIVGGVETTIGHVPYLINLRRDGLFSCGGSLITRKCVLTAAHCVNGVPASSLTINAGTSKLTDPGEMRQVEESFVSSAYSPNTLDMDVAVLKLNEPVMGPNIATIPLCSKRPDSNQFVRVSGWGVTSESSLIPPNQVRTVRVQVISRENCQNQYAGKALISSTMFCASVPGERDSCSGDSGGPVVYNGQVCGIVSWGFGCGRREFPGVYTNVASSRINAFVRTTVIQHCM
ncbi:trypsin beta-like [Calliphora vicina]|uniref:trypsin beta-like n=1 Tax=Calliphora vicina TaxID=7373 RepID=UPI00325AEF5C